MDAKALAALKASIRHWEENVAAEKPWGASVSAADCALCECFWRHECFGCPVLDATDQQYCRKTPFTAAEKAMWDWNATPNSENKAAFRKAAQAELDFLRSLLPDGEQ